MHRLVERYSVPIGGQALKAACRYILFHKRHNLPDFLLPPPLNKMRDHWSEEMLALPARSKELRFYADFPSRLNIPENPVARAEVVGEHRLSRDEIHSLYETGHLEPFDAFSEGELAFLRQNLERIRDAASPISLQWR